MGGGAHFPFPKNVWSPSGGWWNNPTRWGRNTGLAGLGLGVTMFCVFKISTGLETRSVEPAWPVMTQRWAKHKVGELPATS